MTAHDFSQALEITNDQLLAFSEQKALLSSKLTSKISNQRPDLMTVAEKAEQIYNEQVSLYKDLQTFNDNLSNLVKKERESFKEVTSPIPDAPLEKPPQLR